MSEREHIEERVFDLDGEQARVPSREAAPAAEISEIPGIFHTPDMTSVYRDLDPQDGAVIGLDINSEGAIRNFQRQSDTFFDLVELDMKNTPAGGIVPLSGIRYLSTERARYSQDPADVDGPEDLSTNRPGNIARRSDSIKPYPEEDRFDDRNNSDIFDGVIGHAHRGGRLEQEAQRRNRAVFDRQAWNDLSSKE
ncbi:MAG: hypothetical protein KBC15_01285 [Candidatus Levybacteria bacterium]|nr:hypothetical protein [Candidatus Levybacteria bacterium]